MSIQDVGLVLSSMVVSGLLQLVFYPRVVAGLGLYGAGLLLKLLLNWQGLLLVLMLTVVFALTIVGIYNHLFVKVIPPKLLEWCNQFTLRLLLKFSSIPVYTWIIASLLIPCFTQIYASFSVMHMLGTVGAQRSIFTFVLFFIIATISSFVSFILPRALNPAWLSPSKVVFLLQTVWLFQRLAGGDGGAMNKQKPQQQEETDPNANNNKLLPLLSTLMMGWGSVFLSSLPEGALVNCLTSMMKASVLTGSSTAGGILYRKSDWLASLMQSWEAIDLSKVREFVSGKINQSLESFQAKEKDDKNSNENVEDIFVREEELRENENNIVVVATTTTVTTQEEQQSNTLEIVKNFVASFNPPIRLAFITSFFRAVPTAIVIALGLVVACVNLLRGRPADFGLPLMLIPFALGEFFTLIRHVGFAKGITSVVTLAASKNTDGMSILLWQNPKLLNVWRQFRYMDKQFSTFRDLFTDPMKIIIPDEDFIQNAPSLEASIVVKLIASVVIDLIGVATFALPVIGEIFDLLWSPVSGVMIQILYGSPLFSMLGFMEELLPFTDFIPTASLAFLFYYGVFVPVWVIRLQRQYAPRLVTVGVARKSVNDKVD